MCNCSVAPLWMGPTRERRPFVCLAILACLLGAVVPAPAHGQSADALMARADEDLFAGRVAEAAQGYDRVAALLPAQAPHLWQRGIALYYAARFRDCRLQFESHRLVNPDDVENAAWHFLCVARDSSFAAARKALLPVGPDRRSPMREVYEMLQGTATPEEVITAGKGSASGRFYAALYVGLYHEAQGDTARARQQMAVAARDEFARVGGYMHRVAQVHVARMGR
jgi:lipoprotein NlpI